MLNCVVGLLEEWASVDRYREREREVVLIVRSRCRLPTLSLMIRSFGQRHRRFRWLKPSMYSVNVGGSCIGRMIRESFLYLLGFYTTL